MASYRVLHLEMLGYKLWELIHYTSSQLGTYTYHTSSVTVWWWVAKQIYHISD